MSCLDDDQIFDFVAGTLSEARLVGFDQHVKQCPDCRALVGEMARAVHAGQPAGAPAPDDSDAIATAVDDHARVAPGELLASGLYVDRYEVRRVVGAGGMGVVYAAYDAGLHRMVALKLMRADMPQARLLREARTMARLSHPNVVAIYDVGVFEGRVFIAMEYVDGTTLGAWIAERPRPWPEVLGVLVAAAHGLGAAHQSGVVHGDFTPSNVLVGSDGRVRVSDFGLARLHPRPAEERTTVDAPSMTGASLAPTTVGAASQLQGTLPYLAPEQLRGRVADERSDQFAWSVVLYECLYGRHPFGTDDAESFVTRLRAGVLGPPPADCAVPRYLHGVLARGLAVDPRARHRTLAALVDALTLNEPTLVASAPRRGWLGNTTRTLALAALGFALGGSLAAIRAWTQGSTVRPSPTLLSHSRAQASSPKSSPKWPHQPPE